MTDRATKHVALELLQHSRPDAWHASRCEIAPRRCSLRALASLGQVFVLALVAIATTAGCGVNRRYAHDVIRQLPHEEVTIEYAWEQPTIPSPSDDVPKSTARPRQITINYPHPNPSYGSQYAEVVLTSPGDANTSAKHHHASKIVTTLFGHKTGPETTEEISTDQVIRSSLTRDELALLLREIMADGFFDRDERDGNVRMGVRLGGRTLQKQWDQIAAVEKLADQVHADHQQRAQASQNRRRDGAAPVELLSPIEYNPDSGVEAVTSERDFDVF